MSSVAKGKRRAEDLEVVLLDSSSDDENAVPPRSNGGNMSLSSSKDFEDALSDEQLQRLRELEDEVAGIDEQIRGLQKAKGKLKKDIDRIKQLGITRIQGAGNVPNAVNFDEFKKHTPQLVKTAKQYWKGFEGFRYCQEGVCNAMLENRNLFVVMPTGGGKSLCYQLPALLSPGLTVVISPLISLMTDQVMHLKEVGIPCKLLSAATPKQEVNEIHSRLRSMRPDGTAIQGIKLLYVTPERIVKSKTFISVLQAVNQNEMLSRIVLDEAHCCSSQGHDFRPDYKKLDTLKKFFPSCPMAMLTATAAPDVIEDVVNILGLPQLTTSASAMPRKTILFTSPLLRANLTYKIELGQPNQETLAKQMVEFINEHHKGQSGIIYCLSRKDSEDMADAIIEASGGEIKARAYHADIEDDQKDRTHRLWNAGKVQVICATIAFGMGIDKPDVRYVLHTSLPKSIESLYQESGRAGRDGKPADCVLFYRPQDVVKLAGLVSSDSFGQEKLRAMIKYCHSLRCRKRLFSEYFSDEHSKNMQDCGKCDNCLGESELEEKDVSHDAWKMLKAVEEIKDHNGRVTLSNVQTIVRGLGGGSYNVITSIKKRKWGQKTKTSPGKLSMSAYGGPVKLSRENVERVLVDLLAQDYLGEEYAVTPYNVNVYLDVGPKAPLLTRLTEADVEASKGPKVRCTLLPEGPKRRTNASEASQKKKASSSKTSAPARSESSKVENGKAKEAPSRKKLRLASEIIDMSLFEDDDVSEDNEKAANDTALASEDDDLGRYGEDVDEGEDDDMSDAPLWRHHTR